MIFVLLVSLFYSTPLFALAPDVTPEEQKTQKLIDKLEVDDSLMVERHKTLYFAFGNPTSKVQLSFKTYIIRDLPLFFGYSQIIFWNLQEDSKPFFDATYNPEIFYRHKVKNSLISNLDFGGWEHNSNGKGRNDSRSYEQTYFAIQLERPYERWQLNLRTKLSYRFGLDDTNADINEYLGPVEVTVSLLQLFTGWVDRGEFALRMYPGGKFAERWDRGGFELSYSFRFGGLLVRPAFYLQYFNGYAESLLNYNNRVQALRGGISF